MLFLSFSYVEMQGIVLYHVISLWFVCIFIEIWHLFYVFFNYLKDGNLCFTV